MRNVNAANDHRDRHTNLEARLASGRMPAGFHDGETVPSPWPWGRRAAMAREMRRRGMKISDIARDLQCSGRRVYQILAEA